MGVAVGVYADTYLRQLEAPNRNNIRELGHSAIATAKEIYSFLDGTNKQTSLEKCFSEVYSLELALDDYKLVRPKPPSYLSNETKLDLYADYFFAVGPMLRDGHLKDARGMAEASAEDSSRRSFNLSKTVIAKLSVIKNWTATRGYRQTNPDRVADAWQNGNV